MLELSLGSTVSSVFLSLREPARSEKFYCDHLHGVSEDAHMWVLHCDVISNSAIGTTAQPFILAYP